MSEANIRLRDRRAGAPCVTATLRVGRLDLVERTGAPQAGGMVRYDVEFGVGGISVWGEAIPNWISAVGGLIATLVALVAFFQGRSTGTGWRR
ncbi:hypothetical protein HF995_07595 [Sanguibacter hominis ATCC BAA-789]|uniref:Uncharacterized protein n=1 Tax=Sanguibacter hominis ATCC BAA-789 TaxID=1312740 RepID=A0A9X5FB56_9MICO|nr:hypothetical protein [Sanguibacter hominis]NKX93135.1 hypothetical protein [Sanguibacter hominis ATCC BAA-789]